MRRREFVGGLGGLAATWPIRVPAQHSAMPVIGFVRSTSLSDSGHMLTAFREGLKNYGFVEGQNVAIVARFAEGETSRLPDLIADLVRQRVTVIAGNSTAMVTAKTITTT